MIQHFHSEPYTQENLKHMSTTSLYVNVHSNIRHNSSKVEKIQMINE